MVGKTHATLPSGGQMPLNGFGTWKASPSDTIAAVRAALDAGYTHIDAAPVYMNEPSVGEALSTYLQSTNTPRSDIFVTSKVWNTCHAKDDVVKACKQSLKDLKLDYLDLYLMHHPYSWKFGGLPITDDTWVVRDSEGEIEWADGVTLEETWRGLEECVELGLVKDIGVSNYSAMGLMDLLQFCKIKPAVNQSEAHVYHTREDLRYVCEKIGVHFTMYSVLGSGKQGPLQDETVARMAKTKNATPAQVLLAWGMAKGCSVLAKSSKPERARENYGAVQVELSEAEVKELDALERGLRTCNQMEYWGFPSHA